MSFLPRKDAYVLQNNFSNDAEKAARLEFSFQVYLTLPDTNSTDRVFAEDFHRIFKTLRSGISLQKSNEVIAEELA